MQVYDLQYIPNNLSIKTLNQDGQVVVSRNPSLKVYYLDGNDNTQNIFKYDQLSAITMTLKELNKEFVSNTTRRYLQISQAGPFNNSEIVNMFIQNNQVQFVHIKNPLYMYFDCEFANGELIYVYYQINGNVSMYTKDDSNLKFICEDLFEKFAESEQPWFVLGYMLSISTKGCKCKFLQLIEYLGYQPHCEVKRGVQIDQLMQVSNIDELKSVYFVDIADEKSKPLFPQSVEQKKYTLGTVFSQQALQKSLLQKLRLSYITQVPISYALYASVSKTLELFLYNKYYQHGFIFSQKNTEKGEVLSKPYHQYASEDIHHKVINQIAEGDFFSLYGSIIVNMNISPETVTVSKKKCQGLPYEVKQIQGIIPLVVHKFLQDRRQSQDEIDKQCFKQIINGIYGLLCTNYYGFYDPKCADLIVYYGRLVCQQAKTSIKSILSKDVMYINTDACYFSLDNDFKFESLNEQWVQVNKDINMSLSKYFIKSVQNLPQFEFRLETNKFALKSMYSSQKTSSASLICNMQDLTNSHVKLKGPLVSVAFSEFKKISLEYMFYQILTENKDLSNIQEFIYQQQKQLTKQVHEYIKLGQFDKIAEFQRQNNESFGYFSIPTKLNPKTPIECLQSNQIDVKAIVQNVLDPLQRFFGLCKRQKVYRLKDAPTPQEDECLIRREFQKTCNPANDSVQRDFVCVKFSQIKDMIKENPNISYHEMLVSHSNKMYFDIESPHLIDQENLINCIWFVINKLNNQMSNCKLHICQAHSASKYSYHIIIDIACDRGLNLFIARNINDKYKQLQCIDYDIVDLGVYSREGQSLRLPLCVKYTKQGTIDDRRFIIASDSSFKDFIISDTSNCHYVYKDTIHFDDDTPVESGEEHRTQLLSKDDQLRIIEYVKDQTNSQSDTWSIEKNTILCKQAYTCLVCHKQHDNDNLQLSISKTNAIINCFSNIKRQGNVHKPVEFKLNDPKNCQSQQGSAEYLYQHINEQGFEEIATHKVHQQYVQFEVVKDTTYVISDMGTGKSQQIKRMLSSPENESKSCLCLSFRRTFSIEFAQKYSLINYMDLKGRLNSDKHNRLILQIDSLSRYDLVSTPYFLVIDEIESILERILACANYNEIINKFIKLLQTATKVVIMDGLIERKTIEYLNSFRNKEFDIIFNSFSPRKEYTQVIRPFAKGENPIVLNTILDEITEGRNVYGMITSKQLGFYLKHELQKKDISVIYYHGNDDMADYEDCKIQTHLDTKKTHFKNVNLKWDKYQVVLHNSTITAGISFDDEWFHTQVNVYNSGTTSPLSFFQGCHRVRKISTKKVITFIQEDNKHIKEYTPYRVFVKEQHLEHSIQIPFDVNFGLDKQMQIWLEARKNATYNHRTQILLKYIKRMKYNVEFATNEVSQTKYIDNYQDKLAKGIWDVHVDASDQCLYDEQSKNELMQTLEYSEKDSIYFKLIKLRLRRLYDLSFEGINSLDVSQLKKLLQGQSVQEFRRNISHLFGYTFDCQSNIYWIKEALDVFATIRAQNRCNDTQSLLQIQVLKLALNYINDQDTKQLDIELFRSEHVKMIKAAKSVDLDLFLFKMKEFKEDQIVKFLNKFFIILSIQVTVEHGVASFTPIDINQTL